MKKFQVLLYFASIVVAVVIGLGQVNITKGKSGSDPCQHTGLDDQKKCNASHTACDYFKYEEPYKIGDADRLYLTITQNVREEDKSCYNPDLSGNPLCGSTMYKHWSSPCGE